MLLVFSTPVLIRHLWQLKTVVFLYWCLICAALLYNHRNLYSVIYAECCRYVFFFNAECCVIYSKSVRFSIELLNEFAFRHLCRKIAILCCHRCLIVSSFSKLDRLFINIRVFPKIGQFFFQFSGHITLVFSFIQNTYHSFWVCRVQE
jgi:hypothetical protein